MNININLRTIFYIATGILIVWLLFLNRTILTPFILAMIFAYIFTPLINLFYKRLRIPRIVSIILVYILLIGSAILVTDLITRAVIKDFLGLRSNFDGFVMSLQRDINTLPDIVRPYVQDYIDYYAGNNVVEKTPISPLPLFSRAFFGILSLFIFLFSSFFFLKDGHKMIDRLLSIFPEKNRKEISDVLIDINKALANYLRGQMVLIASMIIMLGVSFNILGVKYALTISILSSIFEIVPIIGPIVAGVIGTFIIVISGGVMHFQLNMLQTAVIVALIYLVSRYLQDYLITPFVIGKATKLHPLIILFSVIVGQHLYGVLGVILAVPVAATVKIVYEFLLDKVNKKDYKK